MQDNNEILLDNVDVEIPVVENLIEIPIDDTKVEIPIEELFIEIPIDYDKIKADTIRLKNLLKNAA